MGKIKVFLSCTEARKMRPFAKDEKGQKLGETHEL